MSEIDHELCRYLLRDEAVRAAEDAAAVPAIQHRDLPEAVAALTERVARLEAAVTPKSVSVSNAEGLENKDDTMPADGLRTEGWLTAEEREEVQRARAELLSGTAGYDNELVNEKRRRAGVLTALLARSTPPRVEVPCYQNESRARDNQWHAAIRAAGGEVEG